MDCLPAPALKVIGQYLDPQDAFSCRLAARCLASVTATQLSTSQIRVVANSFQFQLQQENITSSSSSSRTADAGPAGTAAATATAATVAQLLITSKDPDHQNAPAAAAAAAAEGGDDTRSPTRRSRTTAECGGTSSPALRSRTAASLARAAAAGYSKAILFVDVQHKYTDQTWQELFGALLSSSSSITDLTVIEYSSNSLDHVAKYVMELRSMRTNMASAAVGSWDRAAAAVGAGIAGSSSWLLALVSACTTAGPSPALIHLELQLPAPLEPYVQPSLLKLTGLKTLALHPSRVWPQSPPGCDYLGPCEPVLRPCVIEGFTQLSNLKSLSCSVAAVASKEDAEAAVMLQRTFSDLGGQLTHLSFGTSQRSTQIQLSAPLVSMYDLRSLICQPGFTLDTDDARESLGDQSAATGSSSSTNPRFQIAPSLTKLVLNEGIDNSSLLGMLAGKRVSGSAAAAAAARTRTQLVHLELNSQKEMPVEMLSQLAGLRQLKIVVEDKHDLILLSKSPLTSQLQGLSLLCKHPGQEYDEWALMYRPIPIVTSFSNLHSLAIIGTEHSVEIDAYRDLGLICNLKDLKHLAIRCQSMDDLPQYSTALVEKLPRALESLSMEVSWRYPGDFVFETSHMKFSLAAFPAGLTSLKFKEFFVEVVDPMGLSSVTASSAQTDSANAGAGKPPGKTAAAATALQKDSGGSSSSSSSKRSGLAGLLELSAEFWATKHATNFLRHCPNLKMLELGIPFRTNLQMSADDPYDIADWAALQLSLRCPQLRTLRLTLTVYNPWDRLNYWGAVDGLFNIIWPGVTDMIGLQSLAISTAGSLSYNTIVPCLSRLSCLARLRDLSLQFKLDVVDIGWLDGQQQRNGQGSGQAQHTATTTTLQSGPLVEQHPTEAHGGPEIIGPLFSALHGCTGLRRLVLDAPIVTVGEGVEDGQVTTMHKVERCFGENSTVVELQQGLQNCLVLGSDHYVHHSNASTWR